MSMICKIIIPGDYWDSYIYKDNLFLFMMDGSVQTYNWGKMVGKIIHDNTDNQLAYRCAFLAGDYLYNAARRDLFDDPEIKHVMEKRFKKMHNVELSQQILDSFKTYEELFNLKMLPTDIGVFKDTLYYCNSDGVFSKKINNKGKSLISTKSPQKYWDNYVQSIQISRNGRIALSASSDGLYELDNNNRFEEYESYYDDLDAKQVDDNIIQISSYHSSYSCWAFSSLLSGSYVEKNFLFGTKYSADFKFNHEVSNIIYSEEKIFDDKNVGLVVANGDRIYRISNNIIEKVRYQQNQVGKENETPFLDKKQKNVEFIDNIIDAAVIDFGLVVETKKQLLVMLNNGDKVLLADQDTEPFARWRVFPRSIRYVNQIHVVYNNRIEICSVNDDYFLPQDKNKFYGNARHERQSN